MTLLVPAAKSFLVGLTRFSGPCASTRITVQARTARLSFLIWVVFWLWLSQAMGTITAPPAGAWSEKKNYWLMFYQIDGRTVTGNSTGLLDGSGKTWWSDKCKHGDDVRSPSQLLRNFFNSSLHLASAF